VQACFDERLCSTATPLAAVVPPATGNKVEGAAPVKTIVAPLATFRVLHHSFQRAARHPCMAQPAPSQAFTGVESAPNARGRRMAVELR
jgi:hypothetical protein